MKAILKQFAPKARIPPSPNNNAWISSAIVTAIQPADGLPVRIAINVPPTGCTSGQRNIKHHSKKGKRCSNSKQWHLHLRNFFFYFLNRVCPYRNHCCGHYRTGRRTQIIFRYMHLSFLL